MPSARVTQKPGIHQERELGSVKPVQWVVRACHARSSIANRSCVPARPRSAQHGTRAGESVTTGRTPAGRQRRLDVGDVRCNRDGQLPASRHDEAPDRHLQSGASAQRIDWRDQPPVPPPPLPS